MKLAYCITCKGRTQHIAYTLPKNIADNPQAHFVLVDYHDPGELLRYLSENHKGDMESGRLSLYSTTQPGPFRMAHAKNMAHRLAIKEGATVLVNMDADNYTGPGFDDFLLNQYSRHPDGFMWARMVKGVLPRGISGRIALTAKAFINVGGYDERYAAWGSDDKDLNMRLLRLGYKAFEIDAKYLCAVQHTDKMRFKEYRGVSHLTMVNEEMSDACEAETTITNNGVIGCGTVFKNMDWENPMSIDPMPTRIFGIGMHKTATTSLHTALTILGVDSAHWKNAHWAKAIWEEMRVWGRSLTMERSYAVCDLPIPMLFKEFDESYPGSKFILTLRDEENWIKSVEDHWNPDLNQFRNAWNHDPFSHKCHNLLYGHKGFDRESMLARYRRHNGEVKAYFWDRPGDLLVMDMDKGAGWKELCGFLGKPVPAVDYPRAYATY